MSQCYFKKQQHYSLFLGYSQGWASAGLRLLLCLFSTERNEIRKVKPRLTESWPSGIIKKTWVRKAVGLYGSGKALMIQTEAT